MELQGGHRDRVRRYQGAALERFHQRAARGGVLAEVRRHERGGRDDQGVLCGGLRRFAGACRQALADAIQGLVQQRPQRRREGGGVRRDPLHGEHGWQQQRKPGGSGRCDHQSHKRKTAHARTGAGRLAKFQRQLEDHICRIHRAKQIGKHTHRKIPAGNRGDFFFSSRGVGVTKKGARYVSWGQTCEGHPPPGLKGKNGA